MSVSSWEPRQKEQDQGKKKRVQQLRYHCTILYMHYITKLSVCISVFDITVFVKVDVNTTAAFVAKDLFLSLIIT